MARVHTDLGRIASKYDALLAANLHPEAPCDRHVLVKRLRAWANADGFLSSMEGAHLLAFQAGPPARWTFRVPAGDGRAALHTEDSTPVVERDPKPEIRDPKPRRR